MQDTAQLFDGTVELLVRWSRSASTLVMAMRRLQCSGTPGGSRHQPIDKVLPGIIGMPDSNGVILTQFAELGIRTTSGRAR